jgi:predicted ATPase
MQAEFISKIHIDKVRHLTNIDIDLSQTQAKHLIITGKNGSGKTSLLEAIRDFVYERQTRHTVHSIWAGVAIELASPADPTFIYIPVERNKLELPKSIETIEIKDKKIITRNASKDFLKYALHLYVQYLSAKDSGSTEADQYKAWFDRFTENLRDIYNCQELELRPNMRTLEFLIVMPDREPFGLHQMSDGYKALLEILMELLMRFEQADGAVDYAKPAIVIIDELETHLHVELQKRALPFLTTMFPSVQFIVSTHSPFVITSLENAVVYDLEKRETLENPSYYSYESVVEAFLDADMYSEAMKQEFSRYKELLFKERTAEENKEFLKAKAKLELMAPASKELYIAFQALEQQRKAAKNG